MGAITGDWRKNYQKAHNWHLNRPIPNAVPRQPKLTDYPDKVTLIKKSPIFGSEQRANASYTSKKSGIHSDVISSDYLMDMELTMRIKIDLPSPTQAVLTPNGRMDVKSSPVVRKAIMDAWNKGAKNVIIDLSEVEFMDSSGLSALVSGMKALRKTEGQLSICNANAQIRTAMRLTMLDRVFPIFDTIAEALANSPE